jgi:hypothetical protein
VLTQLENCPDIHCAVAVLKSAGLAVSDAPAKSTSGRLEVNYYLTHRGPEWLDIHFEHGLITRMEFVNSDRIWTVAELKEVLPVYASSGGPVFYMDLAAALAFVCFMWSLMMLLARWHEFSTTRRRGAAMIALLSLLFLLSIAPVCRIPPALFGPAPHVSFLRHGTTDAH